MPPIFDAHCHIIDPRFPLVPNQGYTPPPFAVEDYRARTASLGVEGGAVVSGSFQAFDQTYLVDALGRLGPGWAGVCQIPFDYPDEEILKLASHGVRAVRFNLFRGQKVALEEILELARRCHSLAGWHAEFYADAADLAPHVSQLASLPQISLDHLGMTQEGLPILLDLVSAGARVKATGFGRVQLDPAQALERLAEKSPDCLIFGTDLPSTRARRPFEEADLELVQKVLGPDLASRALWDNARALYRL